jgi:hypothetical protein
MRREKAKPKGRQRTSARKSAASDREFKAALARFNGRAVRLVLAYVEEGQFTPKLKRAALQLKDDVDSWRARSGRDEIRVTLATRPESSSMTAPPDDWSCRNCDIVMISRGRFCFLVGCDPADRNCSYVCLEVPTNHARA